MMKKLFTILLIVASIGTKAQSPFYTPTKQPSQFGYVKFDSNLVIPFIDTSFFRRGSLRPGQLTCRPTDSLFYGWNGRFWAVLGADVSSLVAKINTKVDSVIWRNGAMTYWVNGVSHGFPAVGTLQQVIDVLGTNVVDGRMKELSLQKLSHFEALTNSQGGSTGIEADSSQLDIYDTVGNELLMQAVGLQINSPKNINIDGHDSITLETNYGTVATFGADGSVKLSHILTGGGGDSTLVINAAGKLGKGAPSSTPTLQQVLSAGNDAGALDINNAGSINANDIHSAGNSTAMYDDGTVRANQYNFNLAGDISAVPVVLTTGDTTYTGDRKPFYLPSINSPNAWIPVSVNGVFANKAGNIILPGSGGENIYNSDDTLTTDREVSGGSSGFNKSLLFSNLGTFEVDAVTGDVLINSQGGNIGLNQLSAGSTISMTQSNGNIDIGGGNPTGDVNVNSGTNGSIFMSTNNNLTMSATNASSLNSPNLKWDVSGNHTALTYTQTSFNSAIVKTDITGLQVAADSTFKTGDYVTQYQFQYLPLQVVDNSSTTFNITFSYNYFRHKGTGIADVWTLPPLGYVLTAIITNRGTGNLTVNSNAGANDIYYAGVFTSFMILAPGDTYKVSAEGDQYTFTQQ